jgi:NADH-quinone oxidoreductase subunit E
MTSAPSVETTIQRYGGQVGYLVPILQDLQHEYGYLPMPQLREVSRRLQVPLAQVYSVATFYKSLSLKPRGRHLISVCTGTVCHLKGAGRLVEAIRDRLCLRGADTTEDMRYTLETVNCVGACALAPVLVVDGTYYAKAKPGQVADILRPYR